jgi:DNA gyrase subunit B
MDTKVSLLDGRELSIRDIETELKDGKTLWSYSCEPLTGKIVPGLITWAGVTQKSAKVMKITLDNGEHMICTPDHKFPVYEQEYKRADEFKVGDSLIPLYRRNEKIANNANDYEQYFDNADKTWKFTHRMVADYLKDDVVKFEVYKEEYTNGLYEVRHHKNFNRYDNSPENLCFMSWRDHIRYH